MCEVEDRLAALGLTLPDPPRPGGAYQSAQRCGNLLFLSGQFPIENGALRFTGRLGADLSVEQGYEAARLAALNVLSHIRRALGSFASLRRLVRVDGHIHAVPGFEAHARVLDGASDLFNAVLGDRSGHARTVFGHGAMPLNLAVELVVVAEVGELTDHCANAP